MAGRKKSYNCLVCEVEKTKENTYISKEGIFSSYCKSCEKKKSYDRKYPKTKEQAKQMSLPGYKTWVKVNKNHYPDSDWVWQMLENHTTGEELLEQIDIKYELKKHGNKGKKWYRNQNV